MMDILSHLSRHLSTRFSMWSRAVLSLSVVVRHITHLSRASLKPTWPKMQQRTDSGSPARSPACLSIPHASAVRIEREMGSWLPTTRCQSQIRLDARPCAPSPSPAPAGQRRRSVHYARSAGVIHGRHRAQIASREWHRVGRESLRAAGEWVHTRAGEWVHTRARPLRCRVHDRERR